MLALLLVVVGCAPWRESDDPLGRSAAGSFQNTPSDPPAAPGALAPNLALAGGRLAATWLEPTLESGLSGHRLRFARFDAAGWSEPVSIAVGSDFFANWADFPSLVEASDGTLYAHWLAKTAEDTYAYSIFLARSDDQGATWRLLGQLNSDRTPTEHGFVAWVPEGRTGVRAFWLDGREMGDGGPMTLRSTLLEGSGGVERQLDSRVCECCATDAALTREGPLVVYRDRSESEVRDIFAVRRTASGWSEPYAVHGDGWRINGCPVNGPAVDALETRVAVAWFTAAADRPRVQIAFSNDSGASFGEPVVVEDGAVLGRVDLVLDAEGTAWMSWVAKRGTEAEILLQRVSSGGVAGPPRVVARTTAARAGGFPVLQRWDNRLFIAWVDVGEGPHTARIRVREL